MKSKLLLASALALAVVLLLQPTTPGHEADARDASRSPGVAAGMAAPASAPGRPSTDDAATVAAGAEAHAGSAARFGRPPALHGVQRAHWVSSEASHHPQQVSVPAGSASGVAAAAGSAHGSPLQGAVARPSLAASDTPDWRDSARELLSQIGVLCPAAGCDSLEDD